jgi:large subunit ribosomal protein L6
MSRIAKAPIIIPNGVEIRIDANNVSVKGSNGHLSHEFNTAIKVVIRGNIISIEWNSDDKKATAQAGTARAVVKNMVVGVSDGFEKKLTLIGVGYRAQAKDRILSLTLGYSHPIDFIIPNQIIIETPSQTEIVIKGSSKQLVGEVAAKIRSYRPPEPYKGKGVRYIDELVIRKEAKKK